MAPCLVGGLAAGGALRGTVLEAGEGREILGRQADEAELAAPLRTQVIVGRALRVLSQSADEKMGAWRREPLLHRFVKRARCLSKRRRGALAQVSFLKKELVLLLDILKREQARYDAMDFAGLTDDQIGDITNDSEVVCQMTAMIEAKHRELSRK